MKFVYWAIGRTCLTHFLFSANGVDGETQNRRTIGLAFPGGSLTTATTGASIMRGFQMQKTTIDNEEKPALDAFDYVSGLSGGNIPHMQFAYAQGLTSDELLDADGTVEPKEVTYENLGIHSDKSMFKIYTMSTIPSIFKALIRVAIFGDLFWPSLMHHQFLEPLDIPDAHPVGTLRNGVKYTPTVETCMVGPAEFEIEWLYNIMNVEFSENNVQLPSLLKLQPISSYMGYVLNQTLVWEHAKKSGFQIAIPVIVTPDEFSIPFPASQLIFDLPGNKSVDTINFIPVAKDPNELQPESEKHFTVQKMLALGTSSGQIMGTELPDNLALLAPLITSVLIQDIPTGDGSIKTMAFTDGGSVDTNGVPALVKLKTKHIVQLISFPHTREIVQEVGPVVVALNIISPYFGVLFDSHSFSSITPGNYGPNYTYGRSYQMKLFEQYVNGEDQITNFVQKATALYEAGGPIVFTLENLKVVDNKHWGIEAGGIVDLTIIVCLDVPEKFSKELNESVAPPPKGQNFMHKGFFTNKDMINVPNLNSSGKSGNTDEPLDIDIPFLNFTTSIEMPALMDLSVNPRGCKMTLIMLSWIIKESWDGLKDTNGTIVFGGFKSIFEEGASASTSPPIPASTSPPSPASTSSPISALKGIPSSASILKSYLMIFTSLSSVVLLFIL